MAKKTPLRETVIQEMDKSTEDLLNPFTRQFQSQFDGPACELPEHYFDRATAILGRPKRTVLSVSKPGQEKLVMQVMG